MLQFWATMSKQRSTLSKQHSTLSKGRHFNAKLVLHCCRFWQQSQTLLRHCCWCGPGFIYDAVVDGRREKSNILFTQLVTAAIVCLLSFLLDCSRESRRSSLYEDEIKKRDLNVFEWFVVLHSGRTSVCDRRTFPVLRSTCN